MWQFFAAAVPYVASMFQRRPDVPQYQRVPLELPDRSLYMNRILEMGFNPDSRMYELAAEQAANNVNRLLARSGMRGSSIGAQLMINNQASLANAFTQDQLNKAMAALNLVNQYDFERERLALGAADAAYNRAMDAYNREVANNAAAIQGLAGLAQAGAAAYGQYQEQKRWDQLMGKMNHTHANVSIPAPMYGAPGPMYGTPGPAPVNPVAAAYYAGGPSYSFQPMGY